MIGLNNDTNITSAFPHTNRWKYELEKQLNELFSSFVDRMLFFCYFHFQFINKKIQFMQTELSCAGAAKHLCYPKPYYHEAI